MAWCQKKILKQFAITEEKKRDFLSVKIKIMVKTSRKWYTVFLAEPCASKFLR